MKTFLFLFLLFSTNLWAQTSSFALFKPVDSLSGAGLDAYVTQYTLLSPDTLVWRYLLKAHPTQISLSLPFEGGMTLELKQSHPLAPGFRLTASNASGGTDTLPYAAGLHYTGKLNGANKSLVAISIFQDRIIGVLSDAEGNMNLGRVNTVAGRVENLYVLFRDKYVSNPPVFTCGVQDEAYPLPAALSSPTLQPCTKTVGIYLECAYQMFQDNNSSTTGTADFASALFNVMAALLENEQIAVQISGMYIWTTPDTYPLTSSDDAIDAFFVARPVYNGDFAHLLTTAPANLGGIAEIGPISCSTTYAFSDIYNNFDPLPAYSWSVEVMTHETGHNLGSPHTHWCGWNGGALDDCYATEGGCPPGPTPLNGGTIMSYCHLNGTGINFSNGFGAQPGDLIRTNVTTANCLYHLPYPQADFASNVNDMTATFSNSSTDATIFFWDFGDSQFSTETNPAHTYTNPGVYNVCLTASDTCLHATTCQTVTIFYDHCWHWQHPSPQGQNLSDNFFIDANTGWAVGQRGTILKTINGGLNWQSQSYTTSNTLLGVQFMDNQTGWIVGGTGLILKTTDGGVNWLPEVSATTFGLNDLHFIDDQTGWAVGSAGTIVKTIDGGMNWEAQVSGTTNSIIGVFFSNNLNGWAVGEAGMILHTNDGGSNWQPRTSGTGNNILDIQFTDSQTGWAVGDYGTILKQRMAG